MNANEAIGAARDRARRLVRQERFRRRYGVPAPPWWSDLTGYEALLAVVERERLHELEGDVLEIGVFLGGGTKKLCAAFGRLAPTKRVIAVDVFDLDFDRTANASGAAQADLYNGRIRWWAGTGDQRAVFERVTADCRNLVVVAGDSTKVEIPADRLCFAFVDGHHAPEYVRADFETAWSRLTPGGVLALHDYGDDLPDVTHTINAQIGVHAEAVGRVWTHGRTIFLQRERGGT